MPSFPYKFDSDPLSAGDNDLDISLSFVRAYKNARVKACDVVILTGTGTGILSCSLVDSNKTFGVAMINHESVWQPNVGKTWTGDIPLDQFEWIRYQILNAIVGDIARMVLVIEHD